MATVEVNVTNFGVVPNAPIDQSDDIIAALGNLDGEGLGNVAYFPTGIYYVSKPILALVKATCDIMLRGDGYGKTIFKIFPDLYYVNTTLSNSFNSAGNWAVNNDKQSETGGVTLNVKSTASAGNKDVVLGISLA